MIIELPPKVWRPKQQNKYIPLDYGDDIHDGHFDFKEYGNTVFRPSQEWTRNERDDIIVFEELKHAAELHKGLRVSDKVSAEIKNQVRNIIVKFWDCFCEEGARRTILGYEFAIDTGDAKPVCCRRPNYGPYEAEIIMKQLRALLGNDWIELCYGAWGSSIVLAAKPHQEHILDIKDFIWRMCVSYRKLNSITKPFQYPIPRCDDAITIMVVGTNFIWIITVDARQGYHQVSVRKIDREKLAFFAPDHKKYCFKVMPFGPTNAPPFYTCMMHQLRDEWEILFIIRIRAMTTIGGEDIVISDTDEITIAGILLYRGSRVIIDDILLWASNLQIVLLYFECVCEVFQKYRVSFRLDKCDFLKDRVEYVGHDLTPTGNCPAKSKFSMIDDWTLPTNGRALHSFTSLINFYNHYPPFMEMRLKPLRALYRTYLRKDIPLMAWSPTLIELFQDIKRMITSSPLLVRFNPAKPVFLKTDWSASGMAWILMQPDDSPASVEATKLLIETGTNLFDATVDGPRLLPVRFGSRACIDKEKWFHSFVGEGACGRWGIAQNRKFLWGTHFYWLCDCAAVKEILDYDGPITMIKRWAQELLGYHFTVVHRVQRMMKDVDSLNRFYGNPLQTYITIARIFTDDDKAKRPAAYDKSAFHSAPDPTRIGKDAPFLEAEPRILTNAIIEGYPEMEIVDHTSTESTDTIRTSPIFITTQVHENVTHDDHSHEQAESPMFSAVRHLNINRIVIDDTTGSTIHWIQNAALPPVIWDTQIVFSEKNLSYLFQALYPSESFNTCTLAESLCHTKINTANIVDIFFVPYAQSSNVMHWAYNIFDALETHMESAMEFVELNLWIPSRFISQATQSQIIDMIQRRIPETWEYACNHYNAAKFGDCVSALRCHIQIVKSCENGRGSCRQFITANDPSLPIGYGEHISPILNDSLREFSIRLPSEFNLDAEAIRSSPEWYHPSTISVVSKNMTEYAARPSIMSILDPTAPCSEPDTSQGDGIFGKRFGIPFQDKESRVWFARAASTLELLSTYSIPDSMLLLPSIVVDTIDNVDQLLAGGMPYKLRHASLNPDQQNDSIEDNFVEGQDEQVFTVQCYHMSTPPVDQVLDWTTAYQNDNTTRALLSILEQYKAHEIPSAVISTAPVEFRTMLTKGLVAILNSKLVYFKPILMNERYVTLLIIPESLRKPLFDHYHAGPSAGHMGEYKTLYRMRMRFFWPGLRNDVKKWVKGCANCVAYNVWRNRKSETHFSWPVTVPFWIMHVDLWSPGDVVLDKDGNKGYLLNAMCDITQFAVATPTFNTTAAHMATLFMENVVLTFGMCAVVVIDDGSPFKGVFKELCDILRIQYWVLARKNHKGLSVERFHRFMNKVETIAGTDRGTHDGFIRTAKTAQFAWNSAPIDGTDVVRSLAAVGRAFRFPLDVELSPSPSLNDESNSHLFQYLRDVSNESQFALSIVQILVEERRQSHQDRHNKDKTPAAFKVGDIVKAHVQVQSNASKGQVGKLSYQARGPFKIITDLGQQSFEVQKLDKPDSAIRKYKSADLYLLPPSLFPPEPLDMMDQRYLNYENAPIVSPLRKPLGIELFNEVHFHPKPPTTTNVTTNLPSNSIDTIAFQSHENRGIPATLDRAYLRDPLCDDQTPIETLDEPFSMSSVDLHTAINTSTDKLFFIQYTPAGTMRPRWYLVQIDLISTAELNPQWKTTGKYFCVFLARHPTDKDKSDEFARWWPDWYQYHKCKTTQDIIYGDRVLFRPSVIPNSEKYIQWAEEVDLTQPAVRLLGPFNFERITSINRTRNKVHNEHWMSLFEICGELALFPPTSGSSNKHTLPIKKSRKRKHQIK